MSITLKTNQIKLKIQNGNYQAPVVIADQTTSEHVAEVNTAITTTGNQQVSAIQTKGDEVLDSIPDDYTDLVEEVDELKSSMNVISGESYNMFTVDGVTIGTNGSGSTGIPKRAISAAYDGGANGITVSCKNLPSNLKYEVDGYTDANYGGIANMSGGWVTTAGVVTIVTTKQFVRILFGSVDNTNLTAADFEGLEMQIEVGKGASAYAPHITAIDYVARNMNENITNVFACTYNVGMYSYGRSQDTPPADASSKLISFLSKYNFGIVGLQECIDTLNGANVNNTIYNDFFFNQANGTVSPRPAIKTQFQLTDMGAGTFTAGNRPYIYGTATIGNKKVFVICVHFALSASDRQSNYTELLGILSQHERFIVFGDFNAANEAAAEDKTTQAQAEFNNLINAGYTVANGGRWGLLSTGHNVTNYWDNVCVSQNIKMTAANVLDVYDEMTSDHLPIAVDLVI